MRISKTFYFDAAHHLPNYKGLCSNNHGHQWQVEVVFIGKKNPETGMIIDFHVLKDGLNCIIEELDHTDLNNLFEIPTAENIASWIYLILQTELEKLTKPIITLQEVNVWEQPTSKVSYTHFDWEEDKGEPKIDT